MFTGIVEAVGKVVSVEGNLFTIEHDFEELFELGDSVALSGMCTTIVSIDLENRQFVVEVMEESRNKTIFGNIVAGAWINLERSAIIGARNSGHFVLGHVDECGKIIKRERVEDFELFRIGVLPENRKYIVMKGSIAVDGISLTVSNVGPDWLEISIISHTLNLTTLGKKEATGLVNIEYDILGKYVLNKE